MTDSFDDLRKGVVLAELAGHGDGPYCAKHGAGAAMVILGTYIVDPDDDVDYPKHFVFKPDRRNYADYLKRHIATAKQSEAKVAVSVCCVQLEHNIDFLQAAQEAGADYASYCAHSVMDMFVSKNLSSRLCRREHWDNLKKWALTMVEKVSIPVIFKIRTHGVNQDILGAVGLLAESGIPAIHINVWDTSAGSEGLQMISTLKDICEFLIAGGGIKSTEDARRVLAAGADAVAIGTAAMDEPELIGKIQKSIST